MVHTADALPTPWSVAFGRFRSVFPDAPEEEFSALVRDTANCYGFNEGDLIRYLAVEPGRVRRTVIDEFDEPIEDQMACLAKALFAKALEANNLKRNVNFVFQIRHDDDDERLDLSPRVLDHRDLICETIGDDYLAQPEEGRDPRVTVDPSANFAFSHTANSRVAFEYAPGRLGEFHSAVHRAAAHHGVAIERIGLVFAEYGMFWNTPEDEHTMETRGGKCITCRNKDNGTYEVAMVMPLGRAEA